MNLTEEGVKAIRSDPARIAATAKDLESVGGKLLAFYVTTRPYDYVAIAEVPGDALMVLGLAGIGMAGDVRTVSLKAFGVEEFGGLLEKLP